MTQEIKYKVLQSFDLDELETLIIYRIENGWKLQGGVSTNFLDNTIWYFQAMYYNVIKNN